MANRHPGARAGVAETQTRRHTAGMAIKHALPTAPQVAGLSYQIGLPVITAKMLPALLKRKKAPKGLKKLSDNETKVLLAYILGEYPTLVEAMEGLDIRIRKSNVMGWVEAVLRGEALGKTYEGESARRARTAVTERLLDVCLDPDTKPLTLGQCARTLSTCFIPVEAVAKGQTGIGAMTTEELKDHLRVLLQRLALLEAELAKPVTEVSRG